MKNGEIYHNFINITRKDTKLSLEYLWAYLLSDDLFCTYCNEKEKYSQKEKLKELQEAIEYPLLSIARHHIYEKSDPSVLLAEFVCSDVPMEKKIEAYRILLDISRNHESKAKYAKIISDYTKDKNDLYVYGNELLYCHDNEEAFKAYLAAMPVSATSLSTLYERGIGTKVDLDKACDALVIGIENRDEKAKNKACWFIEQHKQYEKRIHDAFSAPSIINDIDKQNLLFKVSRKGYITTKDITSIVGRNVKNFSTAKEFLKSCSVPYYEYDYRIEENPMLRILQFFHYLKEYFKYIDKKEFWFIEQFELDEQFIQFFCDGYTTNSFADEHFKHTPGEAALFLDCSISEAERKFEKLKIFINLQYLQKVFLEIVYMLSGLNKYERNWEIEDQVKLIKELADEVK